MADETTPATATEPVTTPADATPAPETTPSTDTTSPTPGAEPQGASAADSVSDEDVAFGKLLLSERGEPEATETDPEPEPEAAKPQKRTAQTATEAAPVSFNAADLSKTLIEEFGESAKPAVERLVGTLAQQDQTITSLTEQLSEALTAIKDLGGKVDPISEWVGGVQSAQQAAQAAEVHQWFDKREGFTDRYGKGDPSQHTQVQRSFRQAIFDDARLMVARAAAKGRSLPLPKALSLAEQINFGAPTKQGATDAVRDQLKTQARGLSVDPARGGRSAAAMTPEQERAAKVQTVSAIMARARSGDRK